MRCNTCDVELPEGTGLMNSHTAAGHSVTGTGAEMAAAVIGAGLIGPDDPPELRDQMAEFFFPEEDKA